MTAVIRTIKCVLCGRRRECEYLGSTDFGSRWQCTGCGCEFELPPVMTSSLLTKEAGDA